MTIEPWEIRDPELLITQVAERVDLVEDTAYSVLVRAPSTDQELLDVRRLDLPARPDEWRDISDRLCDLARSYDLPDVVPPQHALVTVIARRGRCVLGPNEGTWLMGWRYSNHHAPLHDSNLVLVTEHGWTDLMSSWAGRDPRLAVAAPGDG